MELIKYTEAYTLSDLPNNGWIVSGQITKENSGILKINFSASINNKYVGNYSYQSGLENDTMQSNINCAKGYLEEFSTYGEDLVNQILNHLNLLN